MKELNINELTVEQKIGQLICVRKFIDKDDEAFIFDMLRKKAVGAIQVNYFDGVKEFITKIKETAGYPILICADMEYGFPGTKLHMPSQMALAATNDPDLVYKSAQITAIEAKSNGYNVVWGPVFDLCSKGRLCKNSRTFGDNIDTISTFGIAMAKGFQDEGMIATAKHCPGGSDVKEDTHLRNDFSHLSKEDIIKKDLIPYTRAMKEIGLNGVMTTHNCFVNIDPDTPGTLSKTVQSIIREQGFDGIIMSDSLAMMSIVKNYGEKKSIVMAIAAGNDMVLPNYRMSFREAYTALLDAYKAGIITDERLDNAVRHVLDAQKKTMKPASCSALTQEHLDIVDEINKRSLCFLSKDNLSPKLSNKSKKLFVLFCENQYKGINDDAVESTAQAYYSRANRKLHKELILKEFPDAEVLIIDEFPHRMQNEMVLVASQNADEVIFCTFCMPLSYMCSDGICERVEYLINSCDKNTAAVLHVGNPYEITKFPHAKRVFVGHLGAENLKYALKAMKGEYVPTGKIPVNIKF